MTKAAVCRAFGAPLVVEDIVLAEPGPQDVRIAVKACAICHSDIFYAQGAWGGDLPAVYGHEAAGIVEAVGSAVTTLKPGDRVVATLIRSCGTCHYCARQTPVLCETVFDLDEATPIHSPDGAPMVQAMRSGAFAERVVIHASQAVAIPDDLPFDEASLLACGVITGYGAVVNTAGVRPGQPLAVIGCGGVGLNAVQGASLAGADPIVAIDIAPAKSEAALRFGATHAVAPAEAAQLVKELTKGRGVDVVVVAAGAKAAFESAFDLITKAGTVVVVGMPPSGVMASYDPGTLAAWNQRLIGSKMGDAVIARDIPMLIGAWREGRLKLAPLISGRFPLERINEAMAGVTQAGALRNVIVFD